MVTMIAVCLATLCLGFALGWGFELRLRPETCQEAEAKLNYFLNMHALRSGSWAQGARAADPTRYSQLFRDVDQACQGHEFGGSGF